MRPTPRTSPDVWAAANRVYKPSAGRPGPRDPHVTPYMVPFSRAFDVMEQMAVYGTRFDAVVLACGSQMGKTDTVLDVVGQTLDERPAPIMYVGPDKEFLQREIEPRLMEMLLGAARLKERLATGKRMTRFRKVVGGVPIALAWAGSSTRLRGMPARIAMVDELDAMKSSVQGDGDPFALVEARGATYRDRIRAAISTPLKGAADIEHDDASGLELWKRMTSEDVQSPIWRLWQSGTMHHFTWPCPCCGEHFVPRFKQLRWNGWPEVATPAEAKRTAYLECPRCGGVIDEADKANCNARGRYVAPGQTVSADGIVTGTLPDVTTLSFWVSGLCSPFVTIGERAASYNDAKRSGEQDKIQGVINTGFGELFAPGSGDVPEWEEVARLKRPYRRREVPPGVRMLTLAVDVQKNRVVYTVRGWGVAGTSWLVDFGELMGDTTEDQVWDDLAALLTTPIGEHVIAKAFIDSGFRPGKPINIPVNKVYQFCRRFPRRVYPTKGRATQDKPLMLGKNDVTAKGDVKKYGLDLIWLDTDYCKSWVHERVRWEPDKSGSWHLPEDTTDDYCKQIVSEARVRKPNGSPEWVPRSRQNHYLDCEALQAGLGHMLNVHLIQREDDEPPAPAPARIEAPLPPSVTQPAPAPVRTVRPEPVRSPPPARTTPPPDTDADRRRRIAALGQRMMTR